MIEVWGRLESGKSYIISHGEDADGLTSAAILKRLYPEAEVHLVTYAQLPGKIKEIGGRDPYRLLVSDVNITEASKDAMNDIESMKEKGSEIYWFDHHRWLDDILTQFSQYANSYVDASLPCAADVIYKYLNLDERRDAVIDKLRAYGRDQDTLEMKIQEANKLSDLIRYNNSLQDIGFLTKLAEDMSRGVMWKEEYNPMLEKYEEFLKHASQKAYEKSEVLDLGYVKAAIMYVDEGLPTYEVHKRVFPKIKERDCDVGVMVMVRPSGVLNFRRDDSTCSYDVLTFARMFGGGGHPFAAGGHYGRKIAEEEYDSVKEDIVRKIRGHGGNGTQ